ncbi:hypothetical protein LOC71_22280 [Rhodopirellula sp. JC740]|uniref:Uncharacterized protein n=1 Tax=Rhodopirellula halodulae TaxID=2894198 RepID=A0ABS8NN51_9BACT|nr:hypothetical protein [Rhodopirellula sp. JC740]MCC9645014.1 hypothetical protein [Rhodopirellula sp. JC740]
MTLTASDFRAIDTETDLTDLTPLVEGTVYVSKSPVCTPPDGKVTLSFTIDDGSVSRQVRMRVYSHVSLETVMEMGEPVETLNSFNRVEVYGKTRQTDKSISWDVSTQVRPDDAAPAITFSESFYPLTNNLAFNSISCCVEKLIDGAEFAGDPEELESGEYLFARPADGDPPYIYSNPTLPADGLTQESEEEPFEVAGDYTKVTSEGTVTSLDEEDLVFVNQITSSCNAAARAETYTPDRYAIGTYVAFELVSLGGAASVFVDSVTSGPTYEVFEKECDTCEDPRGCTEFLDYAVPTGLATFTKPQFAQVIADVPEYQFNETIETWDSGALRYRRVTRDPVVLLSVTGPTGYDFASKTTSAPCFWNHSSSVVQYTLQMSVHTETETRYVFTEGGEEEVFINNETTNFSQTVNITTNISIGYNELDVVYLNSIVVDAVAVNGTPWSLDIKRGTATITSNHVVLQDCEYTAFNGHTL